MNKYVATAPRPRVLPNKNFIRNVIATIMLAVACSALHPAPADAWSGNKVLHIVDRNVRHLAHAAGHAAHVVTRTTLRSARHLAHFAGHTTHIVAAKTVHEVRQITGAQK